MRWTVNIDEQLPWHRKVARLSDAAFRLHIHAICWASREGTDGALSSADLVDVAPRLRRRESLAAELTAAGLWIERPSGWVIHDFLDWQPSRSVRKAINEQKAVSGQLGAHRRWHANRGVHDPACDYCKAAGQ